MGPERVDDKTQACTQAQNAVQFAASAGTGKVKLEVAVAADGTVTTVKVVESNVPASTLKTIVSDEKKKTHKPELHEGKPIPGVITYDIDVTFEDSK